MQYLNRAEILDAIAPDMLLAQLETMLPPYHDWRLQSILLTGGRDHAVVTTQGVHEMMVWPDGAYIVVSIEIRYAENDRRIISKALPARMRFLSVPLPTPSTIADHWAMLKAKL